jgi:hypothetical protein
MLKVRYGWVHKTRGRTRKLLKYSAKVVPHDMNHLRVLWAHQLSSKVVPPLHELLLSLLELLKWTQKLFPTIGTIFKDCVFGFIVGDFQLHIQFWWLYQIGICLDLIWVAIANCVHTVISSFKLKAEMQNL